MQRTNMYFACVALITTLGFVINASFAQTHDVYGRPVTDAGSTSETNDAAVRSDAAHVVVPPATCRSARLVTGDLSVEQGDVWLDDCLSLQSDTTVHVRHGAKLVIRAKKILLNGHALRVDGAGDPGSIGSTPPARPPWVSQGDADYWAALSACRSHADNPATGLPGGVGGQGGMGATIVFDVMPTGPGSFSCVAPGGTGGKGGNGGAGSLLRNGRNYYCDGCTASCPNGAAGSDGAPGPPGSCTCAGHSCL